MKGAFRIAMVVFVVVEEPCYLRGRRMPELQVGGAMLDCSWGCHAVDVTLVVAGSI